MKDVDHAALRPEGLKLLAWEGVGLFVPTWWDLVQFKGDGLFGSFRVDDGRRVVAKVSWWTTRKPIVFDDAFRERVPEAQGVALQPHDVSSGTAMRGEFPANGERAKQVFIIWQTAEHDRAALWCIDVQNGQPDQGTVDRMVSGLRLASRDDWRDWAVLEFALRSPANFGRVEANIAAGVCYVAFTRRRTGGKSGGITGAEGAEGAGGAGGQRLAVRRFSAADVVMSQSGEPHDALERWLRNVYAAAFFDMRYRVAVVESNDACCVLRLTTLKRISVAIEWRGLFPRFRKNPRRIDVVWDKANNKVFCFEVARDRQSDAAMIERFISSAKVQCEAGGSDASLRSSPVHSTQVRCSDDVWCEQSEANLVTLSYKMQRRLGMRAVRLFAGQPTSRQQARTTELDRLGSDLWLACTGGVSVGELIDMLMQRYQISYREARMSVTYYLRWLSRRGLVEVDWPQEA